MKNNTLLILSALTCLAASPPEHIPARSARNFIGHERMVCGKVTQVVTKQYGSFINMGDNWIRPTSSDPYARPRLVPDFTAILWEQHRQTIQVCPVCEFSGKVLCVTGLITAYRYDSLAQTIGIPQIEIKSIDQYTLDGVEND